MKYLIKYFSSGQYFLDIQYIVLREIPEVVVTQGNPHSSSKFHFIKIMILILDGKGSRKKGISLVAIGTFFLNKKLVSRKAIFLSGPAFTPLPPLRPGQ